MRNYSKNDFSSKRSSIKRHRFPLIRSALVIAAILTLYLFFTNEADPQQVDLQEESRLKLEIKDSEIRALPSIKESEPFKISSIEEGFTRQFMARQPDPSLASHLLDVLRSQNPYGAFYLMVDGNSGRILAWGQQDNFKPSSQPTYLPSSVFPAASLSKIITAAAALEERRYSNHTLIPSLGSGVTLYRNQLRVPKNYNGRKVSLEKAFASSMNPPMGLVGLQLGGKALRQTSVRLGFNLDYPAGIPNRSSYDPPDSGFGVAEAACGFTNKVTISPLLTAAIVRSILKGETPEVPWSYEVGTSYAPREPIRLETLPFSNNTYYGLRRMFEATVLKGSARSPFRNKRVLYSYNRKRLRVGGKTGTKDGGDFRFEWFAGYAQDRKDASKSIILVCLHINERGGTRASPPSQAAAMLLNHWAKNYLEWQ